jgi:hypothetical protein
MVPLPTSLVDRVSHLPSALSHIAKALDLPLSRSRSPPFPTLDALLRNWSELDSALGPVLGHVPPYRLVGGGVDDYHPNSLSRLTYGPV